jgi:hypothetical protein
MNEIGFLQNPEFAIDTKARGALDVANRMVIDSDSARIDAGNFIKLCKALQAEVKRDREDERVAARATVDAILAARKRHLDPLETAELITKTKVLAYDEGEAKKRREEQARLVAEAQHEAEEAAIRQAEELDAAGDYEGADALLDTPVEAPPPVVLPDTTPKLDGQHIVTRWKCRLVDKAILIQGAHEDPYYGDLLEFDETRANEMVKGIRDSLAYKTKEGRISVNHGKINAINELPAGTVLTKEMIGEEIPGVKIYLEKSMASTAWK